MGGIKRQTEEKKKRIINTICSPPSSWPVSTPARKKDELKASVSHMHECRIQECSYTLEIRPRD